MENTANQNFEELKGTPSFNVMQGVKRRFFAMRNGDLAAQMAAAGLKYKINFGLNLPQIKEIARQVLDGTLPDCPGRLDDDARRSLAQMLWDNASTRCSRLIAPMLLRPNEVDKAMAVRLLQECVTVEEADILCHSLLRDIPGATEVAWDVYLSPDANPRQRYGALRLMMNRLSIMAEPRESITRILSQMVTPEESCPDTISTALLRQMRQEAEWQLEEES